MSDAATRWIRVQGCWWTCVTFQFVAAIPAQWFSLAVHIHFKTVHNIWFWCHVSTQQPARWTCEMCACGSRRSKDICLVLVWAQRFFFHLAMWKDKANVSLNQLNSSRLAPVAFFYSQILVEFQSFKLYECLWTRLSLSAFSPPQRRAAIFRVEVLKCF